MLATFPVESVPSLFQPKLKGEGLGVEVLSRREEGKGYSSVLETLATWEQDLQILRAERKIALEEVDTLRAALQEGGFIQKVIERFNGALGTAEEKVTRLTAQILKTESKVKAYQILVQKLRAEREGKEVLSENFNEAV